ncbi:MAG: hypothetical protein OXF74_01690 [Rhodobacteraceae bacterium]|nr:hypothetical protein [Paracoccaceae bacterium]
MAEERIVCRTPTAGRDGETRIPKWKFDCIRAAILAELTAGEVAWSELTGRVGQRLSAEQLRRLGSLGWHVVTVKLELEVRGEVRRLNGRKRQHLELGERGK